MLGSVGVDVGGTFTDAIAFDPERQAFRVAKVPTTSHDQSHGFMQGLAALAMPPDRIDVLIHGTTVGTNAVLERKGARCGLITTRGFRDTLELGRRTRPQVYGMVGSFEALIPRELRIAVGERMDAQGNVVEPLNEDEVRAAVAALLERGAEALLIHFLHSYQNPAHEERCFEIVRQLWPSPYITVGSRVLREVREFERGSTAAVNAYLQPGIARYIGRLAKQLADAGFSRELLIVQANGGTMAATIAGEHAVQTVLSGPAAGAFAAASIAAQAGFRNVIGCDMGGTSFDVTLIRDGYPALSSEKDIDYSVPVRIPMIDIHTIGAGGGSIAFVDAAGILQVGPRSAGSTPGPICYGRGGDEPTVTDANLLLGRIDPGSIAGVAGATDLAEVRRLVEHKIAKPLGLDAIDAAKAIIAIANVQMAGAIRLVSVERGHDPRDFALFAFGGAGPMHAVELARELGVPTVIVPCFPGLTSALGCILADLRHDFVQYVDRPLDEIPAAEVDALLEAQAQQGRRLIAREAVEVEAIDVVHELDLSYMGQTHAFRIPVRSPGFDPAAAARDFARYYAERFDIELPGMRPVVGNLRTAVFGRRRPPDLRLLGSPSADPARPASRPVRFGDDWIETPVWRRAGLRREQRIVGPAIIEQLDSTTVIDPGSSAVVDAFGNLIVTIAQ